MSEEVKEAWVTEQIEKFVIPNCRDPLEAREAFSFFGSSAFSDQRVRYLLTYDVLRRQLEFDGSEIAETGHLSGFSHWLRRKGHSVRELGGDFRYCIEAEDESVDILLSLEVMEHIKDHDHASFDDLVLFNFSGVRSFVSEMARVTRKGGRLILTTPNPCSLFCLEQLHGMNAPWLFPGHVREYSPTEVVALFSEYGFACEFQTTMYAAYYFDALDRQARLERYFPDEHDREAKRGDDALYIFIKN